MPISRRDLLKGIAVTGAGAAAVATTGCSNLTSSERSVSVKTPSGKKPNLLMVFPDEMRTHAMEFMQQDRTHTPNINKFAKQGTVFKEAVSNFPLCTPFRGMLMTGQYPIRNGIQGNSHTPLPGKFGGSDFGIELNKHALTWSDIMKGEGYSMGYIGKWHLDTPEAPFVPSYNNPMEGKYWNDWTPPERRHGFDFWYSYGTYDLHMNPIYWTNETPRDKPLQINQWSPEHEADIAIKYLRNEGNKYRDNDKPFSLVVSMNPPHSPYDQLPKKYLERYKDETSRSLNTRPNVQWDKEYTEGYGPTFFKEYLAMVNGVDEQFGRIIDELDRLQLTEETLVVFFSDHGSCMGSNGKPTKNTHYEESMRVPMIFRWPGKVAVQFDDLLFSAPDIYPTVMGLMGMEELIPDTVEGTNFAKTVRGESGDKRPTSQLYTFIPYGAQSYGRRGIRTERYTLVADRRIGKPLSFVLHDNVQDPYQMQNIADQHPDLIHKLVEEELLPWLEYTGDPWRPTEVPENILNGYT